MERGDIKTAKMIYNGAYWMDLDSSNGQAIFREIYEHEGQTKMEFEEYKIGDLSAEGGHIYAGSGNWLYPNSIEGMELLKKYHPNDKRVRPPIKGQIVDVPIRGKAVKHIFTGTVWRPLDSNIGQRMFKECIEEKEENTIKITDPISGVEYVAGIDLCKPYEGDQ